MPPQLQWHPEVRDRVALRLVAATVTSSRTCMRSQVKLFSVVNTVDVSPDERECACMSAVVSMSVIMFSVTVLSLLLCRAVSPSLSPSVHHHHRSCSLSLVMSVARAVQLRAVCPGTSFWICFRVTASTATPRRSRCCRRAPAKVGAVRVDAQATVHCLNVSRRRVAACVASRRCTCCSWSCPARVRDGVQLHEAVAQPPDATRPRRNRDVLP